MAGSLWRGRALFSAPTRPFSARIWGRSRSKPTRCFVETEKRRLTNDHRLPRARGELNKHYPVWWIEELFHVWGVLACLNRRAAAPAAGTLDDLERCRVFRPLIDHLVDNAPLHRHFAGQEVVALERVLDLLERLAGVLHVDLVETFLEIQDLLGMKHDVGRLPLEATGRLMQHDARVRECEPHVLLAGSQQQRCHGGGLADA